jgi:hypothetical protein
MRPAQFGAPYHPRLGTTPLAASALGAKSGRLHAISQILRER